jgi:hypothetical protein
MVTFGTDYRRLLSEVRDAFPELAERGPEYCTCSWFWRTTEDGSCISTSPLIRRRTGPRSNFGRPSRLSKFQYLLRDRDRIFGTDFTKQVEDLSIEEVAVSTPCTVAAGLHRADVDRRPH